VVEYGEVDEASMPMNERKSKVESCSFDGNGMGPGGEAMLGVDIVWGWFRGLSMRASYNTLHGRRATR